jgi:predicted AlkP superfamily pyrophosphatase or phosphodiesterase
MLGVLPIVDSRKSPKHTIFITIDGGRYDYLERFSVPNIDTLIENGVSYRNAVASTCFAATNPGIATLSTGVPVADHGICTSQEWYDKKTGELMYFYDAEKDILRMDFPTLGDFARKRNPAAKVVAISVKDRHSILMGGKQADIIAYSYREYVLQRDVKGAYVGAGVSSDHYSWAERVNRSLPPYLREVKQNRTVDWEGKNFRHSDMDVADTALIDKFIMDGALKLLENEKPDFLGIGLVSTNIGAHVYGVDSVEIEDAVEVIDTQIGKLIEKLEVMGLFEDTLFVIGADHGMASRLNAIDIMTLLEKVGYGDIVDNILYIPEGSVSGIYLDDTSSSVVEKTIDAVKQIDHIKEAWYKYDPKAPWYVHRFAHERAPDIVIIPDFQSAIVAKLRKPPSLVAWHGPPYPPDLNIWLILYGAGVKKFGRIGEMLDYSSEELISDEQISKLPEQIDVAPTVKAIWGI